MNSTDLTHHTWPEVARHLAESTAVIIPIGSVEQHGPMGLLGTDAMTATAVARGVARRSQAVAAPTISVGVAQHHLGFPGTVALRPTTLIAVIRDYVESLSVHGFDRFFFVNGHGGNVATIRAALAEVFAEASLQEGRRRVSCTLRNWYEAPSAVAVAARLFGDQEGTHATPSEVSLTWFLYPEEERRVALDPTVAPTGSYTDARDFRGRFPDGRVGSNSALATAEHGRAIYEAAVSDLSADYRAWIAAT